METENKAAAVESPEVPKPAAVVRETVVIGSKDPRFEPIAWVARAVDLKEPYRENLLHLFSDSGNLVATDGKRLHCYTESPLPDGMYRLVKRSKSEIQLEKTVDAPEFPAYKKIIPDLDPEFPKVELDGVLYPKGKFAQFARLIRAIDEKDTLNFTYLDDVMNTDRVFVCHITGPHKVLYFVAPDRYALVMPMECR